VTKQSCNLQQEPMAIKHQKTPAGCNKDWLAGWEVFTHENKLN
jgi:hypothetical protein